MEERLQKILARSGIASRRVAEQLIKDGKVSVDGKVVTEMGLRLDPDCHCIEFEGRPLTLEEQKIYILLNKPRGYVTTMRDPQGRPIVNSLLKGTVKERVFPVGRLDLDTEGALLLTNDGELAQRVQHPSHEVNKTYEARVAGLPSTRELARLEKGILLEGAMTWPAKIRMLAQSKKDTTIRIVIHEGKKRQVRKMFDAIGHRVLALKRIAYGRLGLGDLEVGKFRFLTPADIDLIFSDKKSSLQGDN